MHRFDEEDQEPVAVVRTLSDFALALTLVVLMLIGTRSTAENQRGAETRAVILQKGKPNSELNLVLTNDSKFILSSETGSPMGLSASSVAEPWILAHPNSPATIVLRFPPKTLATELHQALLHLQSAFGTNLAHIDTLPQL